MDALPTGTIPAKREAGALRLILTLFLAGLVSGGALVGVYLVTQPLIERNAAEAQIAAALRVLPGATRQQPMVPSGDGLAVFESSEGNLLPKGELVFAGYDAEDELVGYAIPAEGSGFADKIKLIYGFAPAQRRVVGMEVLESKETPGLGDKIIKDAAFVGAFADLAVDPKIEAVKKGDGGGPGQVDAISGATISSKAVVRIIEASNGRWLDRLPAGSAPGADAQAATPGKEGE